MNLRTCTIEDVAEACGHRMTHTPLISREPCERCADADTETDTGAFTCRESPSGIPECESYRAVRELTDIASRMLASAMVISLDDAVKLIADRYEARQAARKVAVEA